MNLFDVLKNNIVIPPFLNKKGCFVVDDYMGISLLLSTAYKVKKDKYLLIVSNLYKAQRLYSLLSLFISKDDVLLFPADELIRAEAIAQSKEMVANRLHVLNEIINNRAKIVIACVASAIRYLPSPKLFNENTLNFKVGERYNILNIKRNLIKAGYSLVSKIDQSLQFAVRGDILDIYSVNNDRPVRIEFFDDEIESIRTFDIATQSSVSKISETTILPANDILLSEEETKESSEKILRILDKDKEILSLGNFETLRDNVDEVITQILEGNLDQRVYKYYSLLQNSHYSIFDYTKDFTKIFVDENSLIDSNKLINEESMNYLFELQENHKIISRLQMYQDLFSIASFKNTSTITTKSLLTNEKDINFKVRNLPYQASKETDAISIITHYLSDGYSVILSMNTNNQINAIQEGLYTLGIAYENLDGLNIPSKDKVGITTFKIPSGFVLEDEKIAVISSSELFNEKVRLARFDNKFKEASIIRNFEDLNPGDYVVHEYQGIGQFVELQTIEMEGVHTDYLKIAYAGGEFLYVPLSQFQLVRKFLGKEGTSPRLSRLHSKDWENTKKRIKERVNELAERLMHLYLDRNKAKGFAFQQDDEFQKEFEDSFPHELTRDQQRALNEIKEDMEKPVPMDRLLCGDVGFGKTEVAFEAAFKAIDSGKQVAILCPTTLLARQHYELALERFSKFEIRIAVFSRLIPQSVQKKYIEEIEQGKIHLVIGTHRLLSKDIHFHDLGLLIIDEEQRFGVEQKERIKELKSNIDVLTLSATPIPRTLQISLLGVRALSKIDTPPEERMPIQTYVTPFNLGIVKELIERELGRSGQVFFLHNEVATLYDRASSLQKLLPEVEIGVAHGQMDRDEIEDVMIKFYNGDIKVLVCTSIVENGIDVPNANMIIVEDSTRYGLSQLYQIKGRVGRSNRIAYAYLMYNEHKVLNEKAKKRLEALQEFTELGSGYKIAKRDLMIRGAGDILGPEQAGFIDSIGLDMYIKLLNESVQEKLSGVKKELIEPNTSLSIDAFIPDSFASSSDKIELYQEIISAVSTDALARIKVRTRDIFGKLPSEVDLLFVKRNIDLMIQEGKVENMVERKNDIELTLGDDYIKIRGIGNIIFEALIPFMRIVKISYINKKFKIVMVKVKDWIYELEKLLKTFVNIQERLENKEIG